MTGPSQEPNIVNFLYEFLHGIITPVNNRLRNEIAGISYLMDQVPAGTQAASPAYNNWFAVFDESMVRALSRLHLPDRQASIRNEMRHGFILTEYFAQRFSEWPDFSGSLEEFISMLIKDIKNKQ